MGFLESIITAVFCMVVVFVVLAALYLLIKLFTIGIRRIEDVSKMQQ